MNLKLRSPHSHFPYFILGGFGLVLLAYAPLLIHPGLHTACPENDTWNFPVRWSVLSALREGRIPLWNSLSAFGIPWLATWQTESFYPGTLLFTWLGLSAWNLSGILHLSLFALGVYCFLKRAGVQPLWAFFSAAVALLNACAYNHLGSNSSMDTMAWMPWTFLAVRDRIEGRPFSRRGLALLLSLQVFAGYPQIILYTLLGGAFYAFSLQGWRSISKLLPAWAAGLLLSSAQWIPSVEYFFLNAVRLPAVRDNPHFFLPLDNLWTFLDFNALSKGGVPDYVASPTFFYFNFYSGWIPLALLAIGLARYRRLGKEGRFFLAGFFFLVLWSLGLFLQPLARFSIPFPAFLEPAKCWVLIDVFWLLAMGLLLEDLFPRPGAWKWAVVGAGLLNLLYPVWTHPLETNFTPPHPRLESEAGAIRSALGSGRILVLPGAEEHQALYTPLPDPDRRPLFKHFVPNSNLDVFLPLANFYGSTWPTWGSMDANLYFQYAFPYAHGRLMDLLGVDLLLMPVARMPGPFRKVWSRDSWTLWRNPSSLGHCFYFKGVPRTLDRKAVFTAFARGDARPRRDLFLEEPPVSQAPLSPHPPLSRETLAAKADYLIVTQNAMPGWRAWVDGRPQALYLADGIFQAVPLSKGARTVDLAYEPASFRLGLFLSLLAWGMGTALLGFGRNRKA